MQIHQSKISWHDYSKGTGVFDVIGQNKIKNELGNTFKALHKGITDTLNYKEVCCLVINGIDQRNKNMPEHKKEDRNN